MLTKGTVLAVLALLAAGCMSTQPSATMPSPGRTPWVAPQLPADVDLRSRLDRIIDRRLDRQAALKVLESFRIGNYDIQDRDTFWGHRSVGGGGSPYSEYYLTYRNRYLIMFLKDNGELHTCLDLRIIGKTNPHYELATGRVEVDGTVDEEVIVLFNKNWQGDSSTDIIAAFKANVETGRIEDATYRTIRILREE